MRRWAIFINKWESRTSWANAKVACIRQVLLCSSILIELIMCRTLKFYWIFDSFSYCCPGFCFRAYDVRWLLIGTESGHSLHQLYRVENESHSCASCAILPNLRTSPSSSSSMFVVASFVFRYHHFITHLSTSLRLFTAAGDFVRYIWVAWVHTHT